MPTAHERKVRARRIVREAALAQNPCQNPQVTNYNTSLNGSADKMEQLLRLLPLILAGFQRIPELQQFGPLLNQFGASTFPGLSADRAAMAAASTLDVNGVKWTQTALNLLLNASLEVDGVYGRATRAAVTRFQSANNLEEPATIADRTTRTPASRGDSRSDIVASRWP
jgi:hypothetical protein